MKIIILGYNSFVGSAVLHYFNSMCGVELVRIGRKDSDLHKIIKFEVANDMVSLDNDVSNLISSLDLDHDSVLINCISMGDVDKCEVDKESCRMQNYQFVETLYKHLRNNNFKKIIHFSTSMVYDGGNAPYGEMSNCSPVNFYGLMKLKADEFLLNQKDPRVIVVRPITIYGKPQSDGRSNPVSMIIEKIQSGHALKLVDDVFVNILYIGDLIKTIEKLISIDFSGLINVSGNEAYSRYELGLEIVKLLRIEEYSIKPVALAEFGTIAERPLNTSFNNALMKEIGVCPRALSQTISDFL